MEEINAKEVTEAEQEEGFCQGRGLLPLYGSDDSLVLSQTLGKAGQGKVTAFAIEFTCSLPGKKLLLERGEGKRLSKKHPSSCRAFWCSMLTGKAGNLLPSYHFDKAPGGLLELPARGAWDRGFLGCLGALSRGKRKSGAQYLAVIRKALGL